MASEYQPVKGPDYSNYRWQVRADKIAASKQGKEQDANGAKEKKVKSSKARNGVLLSK